ncbi:SURF1 family protein [Cryptosporangium sp. NPDC051539]|uniref:SURF1 family cytochrome oxidase biogenesis protein n=1 Tax=Cryptosporangium sp. NPDC051539 TaxID=3363962 RepID=UPI0037A3E670
MYRFLLSPKWVASFLLCALAALVCVRLAHWQLHRLEQKRAINAEITAARSASPVPVGQALETSSAPGKRREYTKVQVTGEYDPAAEVLVRNRTLNATLGYYVLTPLRTTNGPVLWVVRGWVEASSAGATAVPAYGPAPSGTVTLIGRVRAPESGSTGAVQLSGHRLITRITPDSLQTDGSAYDAYVEIVSSTPSSSDASLTALPAPDDLDEGPHLAYAVQWYLFAVMFLVGYVVYARNYARRDDAPPAAAVPHSGAPEGPPAAAASEAEAEGVAGAASDGPPGTALDRPPGTAPEAGRSGVPAGAPDTVQSGAPEAVQTGAPEAAQPEKSGAAQP